MKGSALLVRQSGGMRGGRGAVDGGMRKGSWNSLGERVGIASEQRGGMRGGAGTL